LDRSAFAAFARSFARTLRAGDAVALSGGLGAGKTTFVRAMVAELHGNDDAVSSPTFVFRQHYEGEPPIEHVDLYRLDDPSEAADLGLDDAFNPQWITLVEWPERMPDLLPPGTIRVWIDGAGEVERAIHVERTAR
jgi:tRNA threonylcarbamoyladenosine biosynthesis protein TsaE